MGDDPNSLLSVFSLLDVNSGGEICLEETRAFTQATEAGRAVEADALSDLFNKQDADGSGQICSVEFCAFAESLSELVGLPITDMVAAYSVQCMRELFDLLKDRSATDADDDYISHNELRLLVESMDESATGCTQEDVVKLMKEYDTDASDTIDFDEFRKIAGHLSDKVSISAFVEGFRLARLQSSRNLSSIRGMFNSTDNLAKSGAGGTADTEAADEPAEPEGGGGGEGGTEADAAPGAEGADEGAGEGGACPTEADPAGSEGAGSGAGADGEGGAAEGGAASAAVTPAPSEGGAAGWEADPTPPPQYSGAGSYGTPVSEPQSYRLDPSPSFLQPYVGRTSASPQLSPEDGFIEDDEFEDCDAPEEVDLDNIDIGHRLYYAGCEAERRKQLYLQKERECKVMNELSFLASPKITTMARVQPSRTDEFRSVTVAQMYNKDIEKEREMKRVKEEQEYRNVMRSTHLNSKSRKIVETSSRYKSPVTEWDLHRERHERKYMPPPVDRTAFSPNINRSSAYLAQRGKGPVHERLHSEAAARKGPREQPRGSVTADSFTPPSAQSAHPQRVSVTPPGRQQQPQYSDPQQYPDDMPDHHQGSHHEDDDEDHHLDDGEEDQDEGSSMVFTKSQAASPATPYTQQQRQHRPQPQQQPLSSAGEAEPSPHPHPDMVVSRLLSAGQETARRRVQKMSEAAKLRDAQHSFCPSINERSIELAMERRRKQYEKQRLLTRQHKERERQARPGAPSASGDGSFLLTPSSRVSAPAAPTPPGGRKTARDFITRSQQQADKRKERERLMEQERRYKEMEGCTFQPMICRNSETLFKERLDGVSGSGGGGSREGSLMASPAEALLDVASGSTPTASSPLPWGGSLSGRGQGQGYGQPAPTPPPVLPPPEPRTPVDHRRAAPSYPSVPSVASPVVRGGGGGGAAYSLSPLRSTGSQGLSPFERAAPSKELKISTHSIEKEISAVLDEWNRIQSL